MEKCQVAKTAIPETEEWLLRGNEVQGCSWEMIQEMRTQPGEVVEEGQREVGRDFLDLALCVPDALQVKELGGLDTQGHLPWNVDHGRDGGDTFGRSRNEIVDSYVKK